MDAKGLRDAIVALANQIPAVVPDIQVIERRTGRERRVKDKAVPSLQRVASRRKGGNGTTAQPAQIAVASVALTCTVPPNLDVGLTFTATAEARDISGGSLIGREILWSSGTPAKATVNATTGVCTAVAAGSSVITASCEGQTATFTLTVTSPQSAVSSVTLSQATLSLISSGVATIAATVKDGSNNVLIGKTVTWTRVSGTSATVGSDSGDDNHTVPITADASVTGSTTIKATCDGVDSSTCSVTVSAPSTAHPDEPAGYAQKWHTTFATVTEDNASILLGGGKMSLVTDGTVNPNGRYMRGFFDSVPPAAPYGGSTTYALAKSVTGSQRKLYMHVKSFGPTTGLCANFTGKNLLWINGTNIFWNITSSVGPSAATGTVGINPRIQGTSVGYNGNYSYPGTGSQGTTFDLNSSLAMTRGLLYDIQAVIILSTGNNFDGSWQWWSKLSTASTYTLMGTHTGLKTHNDNTPTEAFVNEVRLFGQNGGNNVSPATSGYWVYGDYYISTSA